MFDVINLEEFIAEEKRRLNLFRKWWLSQADKELYPESLSVGDWDQQFMFFQDK